MATDGPNQPPEDRHIVASHEFSASMNSSGTRSPGLPPAKDAHMPRRTLICAVRRVVEPPVLNLWSQPPSRTNDLVRVVSASSHDRRRDVREINWVMITKSLFMS